MKRLVLPLAALLLAFTGQTARAQLGVRPTTPLSNPPISPYLNLLRSGANPALNYYGLVRPQMQAQNDIQALQAQQQNLAAQSYLDNGPIVSQPITNTGISAGFLNYNRYFLTKNGSGGSGGGGSSFTQPQMNIGTLHR